MLNVNGISNMELITELTLPEQPKQGEDVSLSIHIYANRIVEHMRFLGYFSDLVDKNREYMGHLEIIRKGWVIKNVKIYDYNYLSLCHRLNELCFQALTEWDLEELKRIIHVSVLSKRVQVIRDILKKINNEIIEVYNNQHILSRYSKTAIDFPVNAKTLLWDSNKIAKSLYLSGFKYTLVIQPFISRDKKSIKTIGIIFIDKGNGTKCIVTEFSNTDNEVEIKGSLFFDSIGSHTDIIMDDWSYNDYAKHKHTNHRIPLYDFVYGTIQRYKNKKPGDRIGAVIHIEEIHFKLRHALRDFISTDIVESSLKLTEPTKILRYKTKKITEDIFIDNLADRLSKLPEYQQYYLIVIDNILSKCKFYL